MNHKLRVLVQLDLDPGCVTVEAGGCLAAQANFPLLLPLMLRAQHASTGHPAGLADVRSTA
ncbi:hypothetical protein [Arthrobacter sp. D1-17]